MPGQLDRRGARAATPGTRDGRGSGMTITPNDMAAMVKRIAHDAIRYDTENAYYKRTEHGRAAARVLIRQIATAAPDLIRFADALDRPAMPAGDTDALIAELRERERAAEYMDTLEASAELGLVAADALELCTRLAAALAPEPKP
jgi:hypothetical protein